MYRAAIVEADAARIRSIRGTGVTSINSSYSRHGDFACEL
jgi:hypothetical protein